MPTQYDGVPSHIAIPGTIGILSSTNTNPIVITTSSPITGILNTGARVDIESHQVNTSANGEHDITVLSGNTFSIPVAGVGVGGATGVVSPQVFGASYQIPSDGDLISGSNNNVSLEALGDRTSFLLTQTGFYKLAGLQVQGGNDPTLGTNWCVITTTSTAWTAGVGFTATVPGIQNGDLIELSVNTTAGLVSSGMAMVSFGYSINPPGVSGAFSKVPWSGLALFQPNIIGMNFHGFLNAASSGTGAFTMGHEASISGSTVTSLAGDHSFVVKVWRPTGVNQ